MQPARLLLFALAGLGAALASCGSTSSSTAPEAAEADWLDPSPSLARQIAARAEHAPFVRNLEEFRKEVEWFVGVGEPAYDTLLSMAASGEPRRASFAFTVLSSLRDSRLVEPLRQRVPFPPADQAVQRLEYARALVTMGDWEHMDVLVDGLRDDDLYVRGNCFKALRDATNEGFGYHPQGDAADREAAVQRWEAWLAEMRSDEMRVGRG